MKKANLIKLLTLTMMFCITSVNAAAQNEPLGKLMEIGPRIGASYYMGDINPRKLFNQSELSYGVYYRITPNPQWAVSLSYTNFNLKAADSVVKFDFYRNLAFEAKVNDFSAVAEFNFLDYFTGSHYSYFTPYIFAGLSFFTFDAVATLPDSLGTVVHLAEVHTEDTIYKQHSFSIPFGVGLKYSPTKHLGLTLEWRMQRTFTDYLDDVSGLYEKNHGIYTIIDGTSVSNYDLTDPSLNGFKEGMQRGDPENKDWIGYLSLTITYKFHLPVVANCSFFQRRYK